LYIDNQLIKSVDATQLNFIENTVDANYILTFTGLQASIQKDNLTDLVVKVNMKTDLENEPNYTFKFLEGSVKGEDSLGITKSTNTIITNSPTIDRSSPGTIILSLNSNTPKMGYILGNSTATSSDKTIAMFDVKAENRDVTIEALKVTIADAGSLASAIKLYDGSTLLGSVAGANSDVTFSNLAIIVAKDTTKTLTVKADIKPIDGIIITEGLTIRASIVANATQILAIDSNDDTLSDAQITGTATGKTLTAYTKAPTLTFVSSNITKTVQAGQDDQADATIVFDVTANGGDIYIDKASTTLGTITVDDGMATHNNFDGVNGNDLGVGTYTFTSTADISGTAYLIRSGQTARFTISGHITNIGVTGYTRMALDTLTWDTVANGATYIMNGITGIVNYDLSGFKTNDVSLTRM